MKYSDIVIQPLREQRYKVLKAIRYKDITVPVGYKTNGANIPRIFWSFIEPNRSDLLPAVIIHDYLCDLEEYSKADTYFKEVLELLRVNKRTIFILVTAVKLYHKIKYRGEK